MKLRFENQNSIIDLQSQEETIIMHEIKIHDCMSFIVLYLCKLSKIKTHGSES